MAVTVVSKVVGRPDLSRRHKRIRIALTLTGTYVLAGFIVDLTALTNPNMYEAAFPGRVPDSVQVISAPAGYDAVWVPNATPTLANGVLVLYASGATEFAAGALSAALLAANAIVLELMGPIGAF